MLQAADVPHLHQNRTSPAALEPRATQHAALRRCLMAWHGVVQPQCREHPSWDRRDEREPKKDGGRVCSDSRTVDHAKDEDGGSPGKAGQGNGLASGLSRSAGGASALWEAAQATPRPLPAHLASLRKCSQLLMHDLKQRADKQDERETAMAARASERVASPRRGGAGSSLSWSELESRVELPRQGGVP